MIRFAICANHYQPFVGGSELVCAEIFQYLNQYVETRVFSRHHPSRSVDDGIVSYSGETDFLTRLAHFCPDVTFVYGDFFDFLPALLRGQVATKVALFTVGGSRLLQKYSLLDAVRNSKYVRKIICHSTSTPDYSLFRDDHRMVVIPNGVDCDQFLNKTYKSNIFPDIAHRHWILNISNFFPGKNQQASLNVCAQLQNPSEWSYIQVASDIEFRIGRTIEEIWKQNSRLVKRTGLDVRLVKNASRTMVIDLLKTSDVFLTTTVQEAAPLVLLESMAAGLPWVCADVGNCRELSGGIVVDAPKDKSGKCVFSCDVEKNMARAVEYACSTKLALGAYGVADALLRQWKTILPRYKNLVDEVHAQS